MRLSLRFLVPLLVALAIAAYAMVPLIDAQILRWFSRDLDVRATLIATTVQDPVSELLLAGGATRLEQYFGRLTSDERLYAVGLCQVGGERLIATRDFPRELDCATLRKRLDTPAEPLRPTRGLLHVAVRPIEAGGLPIALLAMVHDMTFVERRSEETQALHGRVLRRARGGRRADHRRDRPVVVARLGDRTARAAARRRPAAPGGRLRRAGTRADCARRPPTRP